MKAERRHELKTNTLAHALENLPETFRLYGPRLLVGLLAVVVIIVLIRYRMSSAQERTQKAQDNLAVARTELIGLRNLGLGRTADPSQKAEKYRLISSSIDTVLADAGDKEPALAAEALIARGDLNWTMANFPSATTRPSEMEQSPVEQLKAAEDAYSEVISRFPEQHFSVVTAHFGLAAIDENREDWDKARKEYQAVIDDKNAAPALQTMAKGRLNIVDQLAKPVHIGEVAPPTTQESPTTLPTGEVVPHFVPLTLPTTQPIAVPK